MRKIAICKYCFRPHNLEYLDAVNGDTHLIYRCDNKKNTRGKISLRTVFLAFEPDLDIPHTIRKSDLKNQPLRGQVSLFDE